MGRKKPTSAREKLSTDALIWKTVKSRGPITLKDIAKAVKKHPSTVWRNIALLESEKLIRETKAGSHEYVPFEWPDLKVSVRKALRQLKGEHYVKVTLNDISKRVGQPPNKIKEPAYQLAPEEGLEIAERSVKFDISVVR